VVGQSVERSHPQRNAGFVGGGADARRPRRRPAAQPGQLVGPDGRADKDASDTSIAEKLNELQRQEPAADAFAFRSICEGAARELHFQHPALTDPFAFLEAFAVSKTGTRALSVNRGTALTDPQSAETAHAASMIESRAQESRISPSAGSRATATPSSVSMRPSRCNA
jgi:hypothetical protein